MRKTIIVLGLGIVLACGSLFAMNHSSKWNDQKTELNKNSEEEICDECWSKKDGKDALGLTQIKIYNNCPYALNVEYEYWTGSRWIKPSYRVEANSTSVWFPAESYRNFKCYKSKY